MNTESIPCQPIPNQTGSRTLCREFHSVSVAVCSVTPTFSLNCGSVKDAWKTEQCLFLKSILGSFQKSQPWDYGDQRCKAEVIEGTQRLMSYLAPSMRMTRLGRIMMLRHVTRKSPSYPHWAGASQSGYSQICHPFTSWIQRKLTSNRTLWYIVMVKYHD